MEASRIFTNEDNLKNAIIDKLRSEFGRNIEDASSELIYRACALVVRESLFVKMAESDRRDRENRSKKVYYISMEFLMGRSLANNILNLMRSDVFRNVLNEFGVNVDDITRHEPDAGLGNGGLGRLAACFMDSLTTMELPAVGSTIRYEYGLFKQIIRGGMQIEEPDWWLEKDNSWEIKRPEERLEVRFGGNIENIWVDGKLKVKHHNAEVVWAVPYDFPVSGYDANRVNYLRLWEAQSPERLNMEKFNEGRHLDAVTEKERLELISKVLYPEDNNPEGKLLRLKQEYFLSSATIQYILNEYKKNYGNDFSKLPDRVVIHINDNIPRLPFPR